MSGNVFRDPPLRRYKADKSNKRTGCCLTHKETAMFSKFDDKPEIRCVFTALLATSSCDDVRNVPFFHFQRTPKAASL